MPILKNTKTVWVGDKPWRSDDGKVTIWTIKLEVDGESQTQSTMSKAIATEGWTGDVEIYTNAKGKDYVRQAPKEQPDGHNSNVINVPGADWKSWKPSNPEQQESIARSVALKAAVDYIGPGADATNVDRVVLMVADKFLAWLTNSGTQQVAGASPTVAPERNTVSKDSSNPSSAASIMQDAMERKRAERREDEDIRQTMIDNDPLPDYPGDEYV